MVESRQSSLKEEKEGREGRREGVWKFYSQ
jgi:hypothetical protein